MDVTRRQVLLALGATTLGVGATYEYSDGRTPDATDSDARASETPDSAARNTPANRLAEITFDERNSLDRFTETERTDNIETGASGVADEPTALEVRFREGSHYGTSLHYRFREAGYAEPEELHARYYLRFDDDFRMETGGGKLPGPAGTYEQAGWGGRPSDGTNGWSARMFFHPSDDPDRPIRLATYLYYPDMHGPYGDIRSWNDATVEALETGTWYRIDNYIRMNTPGEYDGVLRGWIDGEVAIDLVSMRFRDVPDLRVEEFWFDCYWGGSWRSPTNNYVYFDDLSLFSGLRSPGEPVTTANEIQ